MQGAGLTDDELDAIEQRNERDDVRLLVAEIRRLRRLAEERGDEVLRLSRLLDAQDEPAARARPTG